MANESLKQTKQNKKHLFPEEIPIVFAFDEKFILPASIAILSLVESKSCNSNYKVFILYETMPKNIMQYFNSICSITWIHISLTQLKLANISNRWPIISYARIFIPTIFPQYKRIIYSDSDVLFCDDLSSVLHANLHGCPWAGVPLELNSPNNNYPMYFNENSNFYIYGNGFLVIDTEMWQKENLTEKCVSYALEHAEDDLFPDMATMNCSSRKIAKLDLEYCVFASLYDGQKIEDSIDYLWLRDIYSHNELLKATQNPYIIHFGGKNLLKAYYRPIEKIPNLFLPFFQKSLFWPPLKNND